MKHLNLLFLSLCCTLTCFAQNLATGEWAYTVDGMPALVGQSINDHFFTRNSYDDDGTMIQYDNIISFKSDDIQTVWFWLDDDQIYNNENVQALTPCATNVAGTEFYNEITYNSFQLNIYLPKQLQIISIEDEDGEEISYLNGDRFPNNSFINWGERAGTKVIDGIEYRIYTVVCSNTFDFGCHFSGKNAKMYRERGALKKDDAPLFALYIQNNSQANTQGHLSDMIIANQEFSVRECIRDEWDLNDCRFIFGTGGNNETQRFQFYQRVALYGSNGIENEDPAVLATSISLDNSNAELIEGDTMELTATVLPENTSNKTVTWSTSNSAVATVDNNGVVTAKAPGTAIIIAATTDGSNLAATCVLTVTQRILATSITLNQTSAELTEGESLQLTATVLPEDATNKAVSWSSSNSNVASVDDNGFVSSHKAGTAIITATTADGTDLSATCEITVLADLSDYDNYLSLGNAEAFAGETIVIPVKLTNSDQIVSFQTDIFLPEGLEMVQEDGEYLIDPSGRMTRTHSIMSSDVSNGAVRVMCYSSNYKPFTGNSGDDLFYITVKVADDAAGDYTIALKNTLLTTSDFEEIAAPDVAANVHVKDYLLGDANASGTVTVTDVVVTSLFVLEKDPQPFIFNAADVNADGNITVTDVTRIAWMVLNPTLNAPRRAPALWNNGDRMSGQAITLAVGETRTVSIALDNAMEYSAFQFDLRLPDGLRASNFQLTDRAGGHALDVNTLGSGDIRALCYSPAIEAINGHEGALLTFDVTAMGNALGNIGVNGIELVTTDCQTVLLDGFTIGVNTATSVNELNNGKTIARVDYYNLAGQRIDRPTDGVTLIVTTYTDGTHATTKIIR